MPEPGWAAADVGRRQARGRTRTKIQRGGLLPCIVASPLRGRPGRPLRKGLELRGLDHALEDLGRNEELEVPARGADEDLELPALPPGVGAGQEVGRIA